MKRLLNPLSKRGSAMLVIASAVLLGCARKVQIEVPQNFHGHITILCGGLTEERSSVLKIAETGTLSNATCPVRQADALVVRAGTGAPVESSVIWSTTGDGLVREISFDVR